MCTDYEALFRMQNKILLGNMLGRLKLQEGKKAWICSYCYILALGFDSVLNSI